MSYSIASPPPTPDSSVYSLPETVIQLSPHRHPLPLLPTTAGRSAFQPVMHHQKNRFRLGGYRSGRLRGKTRSNFQGFLGFLQTLEHWVERLKGCCHRSSGRWTKISKRCVDCLLFNTAGTATARHSHADKKEAGRNRRISLSLISLIGKKKKPRGGRTLEAIKHARS